MDEKLLTQENLAERWQMSIKAIENYRKEGIIVPVKGIKAIRYNPHYIEEIEGTIPEPITWVERKLQKKVDALEEENKKLKGTIASILAQCTTSIYSKEN
jgi:hypothetical protein